MPEPAAVTIRLLDRTDLDVLLASGPEVFDNEIIPDLARAFLERQDYDIAAALDGDRLVGMATGFTYFHPDKPLEYYVNEVGVHDGYLRRGIAGQLMRTLFARARERGCTYCWLGTEEDNVAANALYESLGGKPQKMNFYEFDLSEPVTETGPGEAD